MNNICILIPSYNEAKMIGSIVRQVRDKGFTACVIDDGSSDGTAAIAEKEGAIVLRHAKNVGKGAALRDGFTYALKEGYDAVIIIDGDGQHEVSSIPSFVGCMEKSGADMVIGNRMTDTKDMPFVRKVTNRFMSSLISRMAGQEVPDSQCGYRLIKRELLRSVKLESSNFEIESELIIEAGRKGFKINSVPIRTVYDDHKSRIHPIIDTLRFMAFVRKMNRRHKND